MKKLLLIFLIVNSFLLSSCCNCGNEKNLIKGYITVIGNEPFTKLAINDGKKLFGIKCEKELYNKLMKEQGNYYVLEFDDAFQEDGVKYLNVINALQAKADKK
ncbi:MAG: hypothetical protein N2321_04600 [Melioribacteraceae bacterium]|nr:hypothetical protein [Melioribacteraceae bacterium]